MTCGKPHGGKGDKKMMGGKKKMDYPKPKKMTPAPKKGGKK